MAETQFRQRDLRPYAAFGVIALGLWAMAVWIGSSLYVGSIFAGGLVASVVLLALVGQALMVLMRRVLNRFARSWHPSVRHGVANLYRPGTHVVAVLVALGIGVMFTLSVQLLQTSLVEQLRTSAPPDMPNVYMINITDREKDGLWELLGEQAGVIEAQPASPAGSGMLHRVNEVAIEDMNLVEGQRRYLRVQFALTWSGRTPTGDRNSRWRVGGRREPPTVSCRWRRMPPESCAWNPVTLSNGMSEAESWVREWRTFAGPTEPGWAPTTSSFLTPGTLDEFPGVYYGALLVEPEAVGALQRAVFERYPSVTVVSVADILNIVQQTIERMSLTVRFVAGFAILGGIIILASSIAGTRYRRIP